MTSPTDDQPCRRHDYTADVHAVAAARNEAADIVAGWFSEVADVDGERVDWLVERVRMVLSELCTNAVEAAPGRWFRVEITLVDRGEAADGVGGVVCAVTSPYEGQVDDSLRLGLVPSPTAERGRGLAIVDGLAERSHIERTLNEVIVVAELDLHEAR